MQTEIDILNRWPSRSAIAADTGKQLATIHKWFQRGMIPPEADVALVSSARRRGIDVEYADIARARAARSASPPERANA